MSMLVMALAVEGPTDERFFQPLLQRTVFVELGLIEPER